MPEEIGIQFKAVGAEAVSGAFTDLQSQMRESQKATAGLGGGFLGIKPKMLGFLSNIGNIATGISSVIGLVKGLASGVVSLGKGIAGTVLQLASLGGESIGVASAFEGLTKRAGESADVMLTKMKAALKGTVSETEIMRQVNIGLQLGLPGTADEMSELANMAMVLGRSVGRGPVASLGDLMTGIGRTSKQILDNLGIIVNASKAYEDYGKKIGKSSDDLTEMEKKQAFYNAVMEKGRGVVAALGEQQVTSTEQIAGVSAAWENLKSRIGEVIATSPGFGAMMDAISKKIQMVMEWVNKNQVAITNFFNQAFALASDIASVLFNVLIPAIKAVMWIAKAAMAILSPLIRAVGAIFGGFAVGPAAPPVTPPAGGGGAQISIAPEVNVAVNQSGIATRRALDTAFDDVKRTVFDQLDETDREVKRQAAVFEVEARNKMYRV